MSGRKGRATRRAGRGATKRSEAVLPGGATGGQSRLTAYFSTAPHRDTSRSRIKRLGEVTSGDDAALRKQTTAKGDTPAPSQSPTKMARLKSPRTSSASAKAEASIAEWVLPPLTTRPSKSEADAAVVKDGKHRGFATAGEAETFGLEESDSGCTKEEKRSLNRMEKSVAQAEAVPVPGPSKSPADDLSRLKSARKLFEGVRRGAEVNLSEALPLPPKYERLLQLFDSLEVVVSWLDTQGKRITLKEVISNVQRKIKSSCNERHFAQMLSVYPESYNVRCERRWMPIGGRNCNPNEFEYVIEPNLVDDLIAVSDGSGEKEPVPSSSPVKSIRDSPKKVSLISLARNPMISPAKCYVNVGQSSRSPFTSPVKPVVIRCQPRLESHRFCRRIEFRNRLRKLVNMQHTAFLRGEGIEIAENEELQRYHPDFDLNDVDDIEPATLPEMPKGDEEQPESMREYLKKIPDSSDTVPDKIKEVIKELRSPVKSRTATVGGKSVPLSPKKYSEEKRDEPKPTLLERIRAKERERKRRDMLRNPKMEQRKGRLERLSHSLVQCICSYYNLKRVGSMRFADLVDQLTFSLGLISKVEMSETIILLCEVCPAYFKVVDVRGEKYVQLKENNFSAIHAVINEEIKKCI